jgi:hypothetical protein
MQITGHKTTSMFRRYSIVETSDMAKALAALAKTPEEAGKVVRFRK